MVQHFLSEGFPAFVRDGVDGPLGAVPVLVGTPFDQAGAVQPEKSRVHRACADAGPSIHPSSSDEGEDIVSGSRALGQSPQEDEIVSVGSSLAFGHG
jgi:hypothetical protein